MIISLRRHCVFIHIPKCGGESITDVLVRPANGGALLVSKHAGYRRLAPVMGEEMGRFTVFAVVRNPFDQVVSFYEHLRKPAWMSRAEIEAQYPGSNGRLSPPWASALACSVEFPEFVREVYGARPAGAERPNEWWFRDQCSWLTGDDGSLAVHRLLRFESLAGDFARLSEELGLVGALPHLNASRREPGRDGYRSRFDAPTRDLIASRFRASLDRFGYEF